MGLCNSKETINAIPIEDASCIRVACDNKGSFGCVICNYVNKTFLNDLFDPAKNIIQKTDTF